MSSRYRTIVADPPWPMPESGRRTSGPKDDVPNPGCKIKGEWWCWGEYLAGLYIAGLEWERVSRAA